MPSPRFIFGYLFMLSGAGIYSYISGIKGLIGFLFTLFIYSIITYIIHKLWKYLRKKPALEFKNFLNLFIYKVSLYSLLVIVVLGSFMYYQNTLSPAQIPQYTLTNGKQTIVFQAMSHIASDSFYQQVARDIRKFKRDGYVLYYEGVKPGSRENSEAFNKALGINFEPELYENFSKLYGVSAQDNNDFVGLVNNLDYNIDIDINEIMEIYREKTGGQERESSLLEGEEVQDVNSLIINELSGLNEKQLGALRYVNQSLLNFMIKQENLRNFIVENVANQDLFSVILGARNEHIASEMQSRGDEKIVIIYGLMHFDGVLELLQQQDPNWEITSTSYSQLITRP